MRVARMHQRRGHCCDRARRRHHSRWRTVGGGTPHQNDIKKTSKRHEIKKQVIGEDPDLEKSGRTLNRVIAWNRDGITIEADQRHVKGLDVEPLRDTVCHGEEGRRQGGAPTKTGTPGLNTSGTTWTTVTTGTDCSWQMMMTTTAQHSQVTASRGTEHSLHESVTCRKIGQISSLHRWRCVGRWRGRPCAKWNASRGSDDTSSGGRERGARSVGSRVASWKRIRTLIGEATEPLDRQISAGVIMRRGHCLKVWPKKQQVVWLSSAESELYAAVKTASERLGIQSITKDMGISYRLNLHLDASATMCLVNRGGLGKAKHVDMQNLWKQEASTAGRFVTKKVGANVNPTDLMSRWRIRRLSSS